MALRFHWFRQTRLRLMSCSPDTTLITFFFYASLEHLTLEERLQAMKRTWQMLSPGGLWCAIEIPNRLWYYDSHTSQLPFFMWLPDELAFAYSRFSPRESYRNLYRDCTEESKL